MIPDIVIYEKNWKLFLSSVSSARITIYAKDTYRHQTEHTPEGTQWQVW